VRPIASTKCDLDRRVIAGSLPFEPPFAIGASSQRFQDRVQLLDQRGQSSNFAANYPTVIRRSEDGNSGQMMRRKTKYNETH